MLKWIDEFSFRFAQCETSWMGETWMLKSPRTWHNSLLERLYWLVWIMRVWYDSISVSKVIWQLSYVTKLCGTKAQVCKLAFTLAPYTLPRDAWDNQLDPFQPPPGAPHPRKKLTPPLHTKPGINSPSFTTAFHSLQKTEPSWYLSTLTQPPCQLLSWPYYFCFFLLNQRH